MASRDSIPKVSLNESKEVKLVSNRRNINPFCPSIVRICIDALRDQKASEGKVAEYYFDSYWQYWLFEDPRYATCYGYEGFDNLWPNMSLETIGKIDSDLKEFASVGQLIDQKLLTAEEKLSYDYLLKNIASDRCEHDPRMEFMPMTLHTGIHRSYFIFTYAPKKTKQDFLNRIERLKTFPIMIKQCMSRMVKGLEMKITPPQIMIHPLVEQVRALLNPDVTKNPWFETFNDMPSSISVDDKKIIINDAKEALYSTFPVVTEWLNFMINTYIPGCRTTIGWSALPDGKEWYQHIIQTTCSASTIDEIYAIGLSEAKRINARIDELRTQLGYASREAMMKELDDDKKFHYQSKDELLNDFKNFRDELYSKLPRFFKIFPKVDFVIEALPSHLEKTTGITYILRPDLNQNRPAILYINTSNFRTLVKQHMRCIFLYNILGIHFQQEIAQENKQVPLFRKHCWDSAFTYGWVLYCITLGNELGFYPDKYSELGQLLRELQSAIRTIINIEIHTRGMTYDGAIRYYKEMLMTGENEAVTTINQIISNPGDRLTMKIGHLKFLQLRQHAEQQLGDRFDIREFHDLILRSSSIPLSCFEPIVNKWITTQLSAH